MTVNPRSLLDLPGEIRTLIYQHVFSQPTITLTNRNNNPHGPYVWLSSTFALGLLSSCRALRSEASPILKDRASLVCRDNSRPEQLRIPISLGTVQSIQDVVLVHNMHTPYIKDCPLNLKAFSSLRQLRVDVQVTGSDHGFALLPKATSDEELINMLRAYVARLRDRCDWLGEELRKNGCQQRGFRVAIAVDLRQVWDWYNYWTKHNNLNLVWRSTFDADSLELLNREFRD